MTPTVLAELFRDWSTEERLEFLKALNPGIAYEADLMTWHVHPYEEPNDP